MIFQGVIEKIKDAYKKTPKTKEELQAERDAQIAEETTKREPQLIYCGDDGWDVLKIYTLNELDAIERHVDRELKKIISPNSKN